jgi:phosphoribosylglycinamide formyltransferase 2
MVTLAGTQNLNEFELHLRAVLGLPIPEITLERSGASAVILADRDGADYPVVQGVADALGEAKTDLRIFGKPVSRKYRRMGVALAYDEPGADTLIVRDRAKRAAARVTIR